MSEHPLRLGWWLSAEEHSAGDLVRHAQLAEDIGLTTVMISDHLQPWVRRQGHAGNVWPVLGAIAQATTALEVGTGVTSMVHRWHPVNVAHAAATAAVLLGGRFFLGVGTGERLNEQPFADRWPRGAERRARLGEAIEVIRALWDGGAVSHDGQHWRVETLRLLERPAERPPIYVAAAGRRTARLAGEQGDGLIAVTADATLVDVFRGAGGTGPRVAQLHVSLAETVDQATETAWEWWPNGAVAAPLLSELSRPEQFEAAVATTERSAIHQTVVCATRGEELIRAIDRFVGAGYDTVYLHQVGPDQRRLADVVRAELIPHYCS